MREANVEMASIDAERASVLDLPILQELKAMAETRVAEATEHAMLDLLRAVYQRGYDQGFAAAQKDS